MATQRSPGTPYDPMEGDTDWSGNGYGVTDPSLASTLHDGSFLDRLSNYMPEIVGGLFTAGTLQSAGIIPGGGGVAAHGAAGLAGGAGLDATNSAIPLSEIPAAGSEGLFTAGDLGGSGLAGAGGAAGLAKKASGMFSKGLDPTALILSALSLLGGPQGRHSFSGAGIADPKAALQRALQDHYSMLDTLKAAPTYKAPQAQQTQMPSPINIPGLPFQIGGGLGSDPSQPIVPANQPVKQRSPV